MFALSSVCPRSIRVCRFRFQSADYTVARTMALHSSKITCVKNLPISDEADDRQLIVTGTVDGTVSLWRISESLSSEVRLLEIKEFSGSVTYCSGYCPDAKTPVLVASSADSSLRLFCLNLTTCEYQITDSIDLGRGLALCAEVALVDAVPTVAIGFDDRTIRIYGICDGKLRLRQTLRGHEDWVCAITMTVRDGTIWMASASQDTYVRVWTAPIGGDFELETVLAGHDGWVYSVDWSTRDNEMSLLTASIDKSIILWQPSDEGIWVERSRLGEVGGNTLGFYSALFADERSIIAIGFNGGFYGWSKETPSNDWSPLVLPTGHFGPVTDLDWDPDGRYLITCSQDQTTRVYGRWEDRLTDSRTRTSWHEIARPQVHGHDLQCLAVIDSGRFVSGAEEKVLRAFGAPSSFSVNLGRISALDQGVSSRYACDAAAAGASVPALGLSNKTVGTGPQEVDDAYIYYHEVALDRPPTETHLKQNSLWPELHKLYGHGYELYAVAAHPFGQLIASACKASKIDHAAVILWSTDSWHQLDKILIHNLTVTQLEFSPDGLWLLSVSRDRTFALCRCVDGTWSKVYHSDKKNSRHSRIIWCCSWSYDAKYFATGSRDKSLNIWDVQPDAGDATSLVRFAMSIDLDDSVTAVSFAPGLRKQGYLLAIGLDNGTIHLYKFDPATTTSDLVLSMNQCEAHAATVTRLKFMPVTNGRMLTLASCSADCSVKIFEFELKLE